MKTNKIKAVPKLRFPEFRDDSGWIETTLNDICHFVRGPFGGALKKDIFVENGYAVYEQAHAIYGNFDSFRYFITKDKFDELKRFEVKADDLIMSCSGTMGKFSRIPNNPKKGVINQALLKLTVKKGYKTSFIKTALELPSNQNKLLLQSAGGAVKNVVGVKLIKQINIAVPKLNEQQKIANCLSSLDTLIKAESEQLEVLKEYKAGLLQQLFPVEGETTPKRRFAEFEGDGNWEEVKLVDVVDYANGKAHEQDIEVDGKFIVVNSKFIATSGKVRKYSNTANLLAKANDVLMVLSDVPNGRAIAKCFLVESDNSYTVNQRIAKLAPKSINPIFLYYILNRNPYFIKFDDGVKQTNLRKDVVLDCPLKIPTNLEQQKIAECLNSLDNLIQAKAEEVKALKDHKLGLMQQLFPMMDDR